MGATKKIGDVVYLYHFMLHKIISSPDIFTSNRLATSEEIKRFNELYNETF